MPRGLSKFPLLRISAGIFGFSALLGVLVEADFLGRALRPVDLMAVFWSIVAVVRLKKELLRSWQSIGGGVFVLMWIFLMSVWQQHELVATGLYLTRWGVYLFAVFSLSLWLRKEDQGVQIWVDIFALFWMGVGIMQYLLLPDARIFFWLGWDDHLFRAFGTVLDPLFFGLTCALLSWRFWRRRDILPLFSSTLLSLSFLGSVLSYSRLALLGIFIWTGLETWKSRSWRNMAFLVLLLTTLVVLIPKDGGGEGQKLLRSSTLTARQDTVTEDLHATRTEWLFGSGWYLRQSESQNGIIQNSQMADTLWLQLYLSIGAIGLVSVFLIWLRLRIWDPIFLWHVAMNALSLASFSPWVLLASALIPGETKNPRSDTE